MKEVITISIPSKLRKKIDIQRGLIPRSKYIVKKLESIHEKQLNEKCFDSSDSTTAAKQQASGESTHT